MKKLILSFAIMSCAIIAQARTLIVYYSYTNNVERIINELRTHIDADILEIEPAEKGLDYAADNYAIGSSQIAAIRANPYDISSYPAIDPVAVDLTEYDCIIIGAPLWWSNMAAPLQSFLFQYGRQMNGKNICLIVSSASSGISGVESDAKRLIPGGNFVSPSLWIRSSQTSNARSLLENWLNTIDYKNISAGIEPVGNDSSRNITIYSLSGARLFADTNTIYGLPAGFYIINSRKTFISK